MATGFLVGVWGVGMLSLAAYSTIQYRSLLKITEEFTGPTIDVVVELMAGLFLCMWAALNVPGMFLSILPDSDENRAAQLPSNLDFMIFDHRGKTFPLDTNVKLS